MLPTIFTLGVAALAGVCVDAQAATPGRTTEAEEAAITDPSAECEPYYYPPVANALASFPIIWQPASILTDDDNAASKWASIQPSVPNISPKGTPEGNFEGLNYPADDPDCWWTNTKCTTPKAPGVPADVVIMPEPQTLGYGFDDGPNCSHNAFYDYLAQQNQKATMFYIGSNVMDWPLEAARAVADGHEICVHSWSHRYMTSLPNEEAFAELYYSVSSFMQAVKLATGVTPTCWRPPFGDIDDRIRAIANGLGLRSILWEYDSQDWQVGVSNGVTSQDVDNEYQRLIDDANKGLFNHTGTMLLMHELNDYTMTEAMKYLPLLKAAFQHIVPVTVGLNITEAYPESGYTFPTFAQYIAGTGASLARNISATGSAGSSASASPNSSPPPVSGNERKTGNASRLLFDGLGGVKVIAAVGLAVVLAAVVGLAPS